MIGPPERPGYDERPEQQIYQQQPQQRSVTLPSYRPWLAWVLLVANIVVYILTRQAQVPGEPFVFVLQRFGAKWGPGIDAGEYWRLLTPVVLHGSLAHLGFNSYALYALGPATESIFGTLRFAAIYLIAGLMGSLLSYAFHPEGTSVGASGAIFGLMGALAAFYWRGRDTFGETSKAQLQQIGWLAAINLLIGLSVENIDNFGHLGGLLGGTLAGLALAPRFRVSASQWLVELRRDESGPSGWLMIAGLLGLIAVATLTIQALH